MEYRAGWPQNEPAAGPVLTFFSVSEVTKNVLIFKETFLHFTSLGMATTKMNKRTSKTRK